MQDRAIQIILTIGGKNLSHKNVKSVQLERNFSDTANKFTITLVDTPELTTTDLELYMNSGYRSLKLSYGDKPDLSNLVSFSGTIWDYQNNFVGNIKELQITGYLNKVYGTDSAGTALYNIDFNSYFNLRENEEKPWNVNYQQYFHEWNYSTWIKANKNMGNAEQDMTVFNSDVIFKTFHNYYTANSLTMPIKGPSGNTINLPIPDSFTQMQMGGGSDEENEDKEISGQDVVDYDDANDPENRLWGKLVWKRAAKYKPDKALDPDDDFEGWLDKIRTQTAYYREKDTNKIRAFSMDSTKEGEGTFYIQMNPKKSFYGAGTFMYNSLGVDISYIVEQLATLEGWSVANIVQTELVPCSDQFKMNNQSALAFINDVLIPNSITPIGNYYSNASGKYITLSKGQSGFVAYWDENNKFHYEPLNLDRATTLNLGLGYNKPNSPVLSFQVNTKGTAFYTQAPQTINAMSIATGQEQSQVVVAASQVLVDYNKVKEFNENIASFFGYTYEQVQKEFEKGSGKAYQVFQDLWSGVTGHLSESSSKSFSFSINDTGYTLGKGNLSAVANAIQKNLVTSLPASGINSSIDSATTLAEARTKIQNFLITASMTLWGDTRINPGCIIQVENYVKSQNNYVSVHPSSGKFLVLKQVDNISNDSYTQQLSLLRSNDSLKDQVDEQKIDWTKSIQAAKGYEKANPAKKSSSSTGATCPFDEKPNTSYTPPGMPSYPPTLNPGNKFTYPPNSLYQNNKTYTPNLPTKSQVDNQTVYDFNKNKTSK